MPETTKPESVARDRIFIDGRWVKSHGTDTFTVIDSNTEQAMGSVPRGTADDVRDAVAAARRAFGPWSERPIAERAAFVAKISDAMAARADELALLISREVGMPMALCKRVQIAGPLAQWKFYAQLGTEVALEEQVGNSLVVREAVGVVAAITPWNYPLNQITLKVAPALLAGCTVVLKPSEVAPLNAFVLAEAIESAGLPPGVFNLVMGDGPTVGEALAAHPEVDCVTFTGSTRAGQRVSELAARSCKRVSLELGGKSASVVLDGADLNTAITGTLSSCFLNSGQTCVAQTRLLVSRQRFEEAKQIAKQVAEGFAVGDAFNESSRVGPLVSATQLERVRGFIERGLAEGAQLLTGGAEPPSGLTRGFFARPTVFATEDANSTIAKEEIFGPVLTVIPFEDEDDAVRIANATAYGLGGAVWAGSDADAVRVARRIRTGQININGGPFNGQAPFGGFKQSGHGREGGRFGLDEFLEYKAMHLRLPEQRT